MFSETLRLYKFKSEVNVLENIDKKDLAAITAASYTFVYPFSIQYSHALEAMQCEAPVIISGAAPMQEICNTAALYFDGNDHKDIADKMMMIYKDENVRRQLIEKGREQVKIYSWDNSADLLWKSVEKAAN